MSTPQFWKDGKYIQPTLLKLNLDSGRFLHPMEPALIDPKTRANKNLVRWRPENKDRAVCIYAALPVMAVVRVKRGDRCQFLPGDLSGGFTVGSPSPWSPD